MHPRRSYIITLYLPLILILIRISDYLSIVNVKFQFSVQIVRAEGVLLVFKFNF